MLASIDVETSKAPSHFPWREGSYLSCVVIVEDGGKVHQWVINHNSVGLRPLASIVAEIQRVLDRVDLLIGHNIKFDLHWLKSIGLKMGRVHDTMVCEYILNGQDNTKSVSLDETSKRYGLIPKLDVVKQYWNSGVDTASVPLETLMEYCIWDTALALQVYHLQVPKINEMGVGRLVKLHNYFVECLQEIEENGMKVDVPFLQKSKEEYKTKIDTLNCELLLFIEEYFDTDFKFNMSSNDHLSVILYGGTLGQDFREKYTVTLKSGEVKTKERWQTQEYSFKGLGFKPNPKEECKKKGFYKTNKAVLVSLTAKTKAQKYFVSTIQELSGLEKIYSTYLEGMEKHLTKTNYIHPNFNQAFTVTGRLSSSAPNMQNLPRGGTDVVAKRLFIARAPDRLIVNADLGALEWCGGCQLSGDEKMLEEISNGVDIHTDNAITAFGDVKYRQESKVLTFRSLYGGSAYAFFMDPNMPSKPLEEWEDIQSRFYKKYKGLKKWQDDLYALVCKQGWYSTFTGRRYVFHKEDGKYSRPAVCNYAVQGTSTGDVVPFVMMLIRKQIKDEGLDALMICQVHDSILFDALASDVDRLGEIVYDHFVNLPTTISKYFNYRWYTPMTGEVEVGRNYKELQKLFGKTGRVAYVKELDFSGKM